jgi:DNA polymerase-3 subunit epsilon
MALQEFEFMYQNFFIIDGGRSDGEVSVVKIENGRYMGYGYLSSENLDRTPDLLHDCIQSYPDNRDIQQIIRSYLRKNSVTRIVPYQ